MTKSSNKKLDDIDEKIYGHYTKRKLLHSADKRSVQVYTGGSKLCLKRLRKDRVDPKKASKYTLQKWAKEINSVRESFSKDLKDNVQLFSTELSQLSKASQEDVLKM